MRVITVIKKNEYPKQLLEIPEPPENLFVRGTLPAEETKFLCVVGSRKYTKYGEEACIKIISELRGYPIAIVSGLALGIDAIAHKAALRAGLTAIAFPGSGLNEGVLYPASNYPLARRILEAGGALVSEFEPDFKATPYAFPQRNRLMAGISHAVVIVEAAEKSGTLITARLALDYNRDVFVVPGPIFSNSSVGSNHLLKEGAAPITSGSDLLDHWGFETNAKTKNQNVKVIEDCSPEEKLVLRLLHEPVPKDKLVLMLEMPIHEANILLSKMEIKGIIKEVVGEVQISV